MHQSAELAQSILEELAYFDLFDFPLTPVELWRYSRPAGATVAEVVAALESDPRLVEQVGQRHGFWFLKGRADVVDSRLRRYREAEAKFQKAITYVKRISRFPFVRMIGVCNSLAYSNSRRDADIDLFIVTQPGRIWTSRMYITGYLKLLNQRPRTEQTRDTLCASFFVTEDNLDLASLRRGQPDIYLAHWIWQLVPLYDASNLYQKFVSANAWARQVFPNAYPNQPIEPRLVADQPAAKNVKSWVEAGHSHRLGRHWERFNERYQRNVLPPRLKDLANVDSRVVLSDKLLKFHDNDRREEYQRRWVDSVSALR